MCGIYQNPYEIARSLTVAATEKVVINPAGKSVEESNAELGRQVALVYRTILRELLRDELTRDGEDADFDSADHVHSHTHDHGDGAHSHEHTHSHTHSH
jgi:ABC-type Zn2+ transport system substrate-binding protein/surface adhesin